MGVSILFFESVIIKDLREYLSSKIWNNLKIPVVWQLNGNFVKVKNLLLVLPLPLYGDGDISEFSSCCGC